MAKKLTKTKIDPNKRQKGESLFDFLERMAFRAGIQARTRESMEWFRQNIRNLGRMTGSQIMRDSPENLRTLGQFGMGRMYFFFYDPKHKKTLPYYDRFPLVIPIERYSDGFLGLNLHYLDPRIRARLLDRLLEITNNKKFDETTKMRLTYGVIKGVARMRAAQPCIKRYLKNHLRSKLLQIPSYDWEIAIFLPVESFEKATKQKVWRDSKKVYGRVR